MGNRVADHLLLTAAPPLAAVFIRGLSLSMRIEEVGREHLLDCPQSAIFSCWHDQLLLILARAPRGPSKALISASRDGELIARTIAHFGMGVIRGSSSRGGGRAFRELLREARTDVDLGITPDGPRGPRHCIKDGVVQLAAMTGRPVIPLAFACSRGHRFASWDRFLLPYPLARGVLAYGPAVVFETGEDVAQFGLRLKKGMEEINAAARRRLEDYGVPAV